MNGPTIVRALFGSVRRTSKAPMSCVEGVMTIILFYRRDGLDRKRMDALAGQVAERLVDRALARHAIHSGEARPYDGQAEMRLAARSEEHTSELQSLLRTSYAVFCLYNTNS